MPERLSRGESDVLAARLRESIDRNGWGFWAVEAPGVASFIGFVGLARPRFEAHFTPCIEIGWRLARAHWGEGYATEAAGAMCSIASLIRRRDPSLEAGEFSGRLAGPVGSQTAEPNLSIRHIGRGGASRRNLEGGSRATVLRSRFRLLTENANFGQGFDDARALQPRDCLAKTFVDDRFLY